MWLLLRSQCVHALRRPHIRALSYTLHLSHGATLTLRVPYSTVDTQNAPSAGNISRSKEFPIDVMARQQAMHSLDDLLKKGEPEQARKQLADILASCQPEPDTSVPFQRLLEVVIAASPGTPNLKILIDLGIAAASKGHADWTRKAIMPFVEACGTQEMASAFEKDIDSFDGAAPGAVSCESFFEDTNKDYIAASPIEIVPEPTIEEIIGKSLPATLPESIQADESIFEDNTQAEYSGSLPTDESHADAHSRHLSLGLLRNLISRRQLDKAYSLLVEMKELGLDIPPHPIFATVAKKIATERSVFSPELAHQILKWLSLAPENSRIASLELRTISGHVADCTGISNNFLARVSILFASKGYAGIVAPMLNALCHGLRGQRLRDFIHNYEAAYIAYWKRSNPEIVGFRNKFLADTRNTVIRILGGTGRHNEIAEYLPWDEEFSLWPSTYAHVLLYPVGEDTKGRIVKLLSQLSGERELEQTIRKIRVHSLEPPVDFRNDLVGGLKYLKRCVASQTQIPHTQTVSHFMDAYLSSGRLKGLRIIFDRALKSNRPMAKTFVLGEMLFYRRLKHYDLVIETFVDHFHLLGVPHQLVLQMYHNLLRRRREYNPDSEEKPPLQRFYEFDQDTFRGRKMIPLMLHCNLVWEALIATHPPSAVEGLYEKFLFAAHEREPQWHRRGKIPSKDQDTLRPPMVQPSSFVPFIRPLIELKGPEAGLRIINDILDLRLLPHLPIYTEIAGAYARVGKVEEAFKIMHQLESKQRQKHFPRNGKAMRFRHPLPDFAFYVSLLKGFVLSKNVEAAEEIVGKVQSKYRPQPRQNLLYDETLDLFRQLKSGDLRLIDRAFHTRQFVSPKSV